MKKGLIVSVVMVMLAVTGCSSGPKVYDKSVPMEKSCTLVITSDVGIVKFNEEKVAWMGTVIIPADLHSWILRYKELEFDGIGRITGATQHDISMVYTFLPEHTYMVAATSSNGKVTGQIMDITSLNIDLPSPDPMNANASPFEGEWEQIKNEKIHLIIAKDEWITKAYEKYSARGFVSYNGENANLTIFALYDTKKEKWNIAKKIGSMEVTLKDGNLNLAGYLYKKITPNTTDTP